MSINPDAYGAYLHYMRLTGGKPMPEHTQVALRQQIDQGVTQPQLFQLVQDLATKDAGDEFVSPNEQLVHSVYNEMSNGQPMSPKTRDIIRLQAMRNVPYTQMLQTLQNHVQNDIEFDNSRDRLVAKEASGGAVDRLAQYAVDVAQFFNDAINIPHQGVDTQLKYSPPPVYPMGSDEDADLLRQMGHDPDIVPKAIIGPLAVALKQSFGVPEFASRYVMEDPRKAMMDVAFDAIPVTSILPRLKDIKWLNKVDDASAASKVDDVAKVAGKVDDIPVNTVKQQPKTFGVDVSQSRFYKPSGAGAEPPVMVADDDLAKLTRWKEGGMKTPPPEVNLSEGQVERFARGDLQLQSKSAVNTPKPKPVEEALPVARPVKDMPTQTVDVATSPVETTPVKPKTNIMEKGKGTVEFGYKQANRLTQDLIDRIAAKGGKSGEAIAETARRVVSKAKTIGGQFQQDLIQLDKKYGSGLIRKRSKDVNDLDHWLQTVDNDGIANLQKLVEGKIAPSTPAQQSFLADYKAMYDKMADVANQHGMKRQLNDGSIVPVQRSTGQMKLIRHYTPDFYDLMRRNDSRTQRFYDKVASLNGWKPDQAKVYLDELATGLSDPGVGFLEHQRKIPVMPSKFEDINILDTSIRDTFHGMAKHTSDRIAAASELGQNLEGLPSRLNELRADWVREHGPKSEEMFNELVRSLHGINPKRVGDGLQTQSKASRVVWGAVKPAFRALWKSAAPISNLPEAVFMPKSGSLASLRDSLRARGVLLKNYRKTVNTLMERGAKDRQILTRDFTPGREIEGAGRIIEGSIDRATGNYWLNEFQETLSGATALEMEARLKAGKIVNGDKAALRALKFTEKEVADMLAGKANSQTWDDFVQRFVTYTTGANSRNAERSITELNRHVNRWFSFQNYPQMTARHFDGLTKSVTRSIKADGFKGVMDSMPMVAKSVGLHGASGAASLIMGAVIAGKIPDLGDDWKQVAVNSMVAAAASPQVRATMSLIGADDFSEFITSLSPDIRQIVETFNATMGAIKKGKGKYADKDILEVTNELAKATFPLLNKTQSAYMTLAGTVRPEVVNAERQFYKMIHELDPSGAEHRIVGYDEFRKYRKLFKNALVSGDLDKAEEYKNRAFGVAKSEQYTDKEAEQSLNASLRQALTVKGLSDEQRKMVKKRIGQKNFDILMKRDEIIQTYIDEHTSPEKRRRPSPLARFRGRMSPEYRRERQRNNPTAREMYRWQRTFGER